MHIGIQLHAPIGYELLERNTAYHFLRSDSTSNQVMLVYFAAINLKRSIKKSKGNSLKHKPTVIFMDRARFERGLAEQLIVRREIQEELPIWFDGMTIEKLRSYSADSKKANLNHQERIDTMLSHIWPLVEKLDEVLNCSSPDAIINAHARACSPPQHETRLRTAFYAYICFGFDKLALHYPINKIGRWDRMSRNRKFGRPSIARGPHHGYGSNDHEMIKKIIEGYRQYAGPGKHMAQIYRQTILNIFGCKTGVNSNGLKEFIHPGGKPFPTYHQFRYRVDQAVPLLTRQIHKYGQARVRNRLQASQGRYSEAVGNNMEKTEADAYSCSEVVKGYLEGSHLPKLWVVRIRCLASRLLTGIGFSLKGEAASAYRMALFCQAIDKVKFCKLFGLEIEPNEWPSKGGSPHAIHDRGPGSTNGADTDESGFRPVIKEIAPTYSGQSKASIESSHPRDVQLEGAPAYIETSMSFVQLGVREIVKTVAANHAIDISDSLGNDALIAGVLPTPIHLWNYLDGLGRTYATPMTFEQAVRAYLTPIEVTVRNDGVYFKAQRFSSEALRLSGILQQSHDSGRFSIKAYMLDVCVRHLWVETASGLVEIDAMLSIRGNDDPLYISVLELEQLEKIRRKNNSTVQSHRLAVAASAQERFKAQTGLELEQGVLKNGRPKRGGKNSLEEQREVIPYLRAIGGKN